VGEVGRRARTETAQLRRRRLHGHHPLEEITKRAGGEYGEFRSFDDYVDMITAIGRTPVERSTDYRTRRRIDPDDNPHGPRLGPRADGTPMLSDSSSGGSGKSGASGASDGESSGADD